MFFFFFSSAAPLPFDLLLSHHPSLSLSLPLPSTFNTDHRPSPHTHTQQLELKEYLTKVYGFDIATLRTSVLAGKKKRGKAGNAYARPDIKKVYVSLKPPSSSSSQ